jgi:hypothetical protein
MQSLAKSEHFWSLLIEPGWVQAAIWTIEDQQASLVSVGPATHWEETELVNAADSSLSAAIQNLPEDAPEPSKTVFGVAPFWVSEGQIKPEYLEKIKILCSKLSLEPAGFVVLPEAIAHLVKSEQGSPLTAVIIGIGPDALNITLFKLGNLIGTVTVARSVSLVDDVIEGLTRFGLNEPLPSQFLLYNGKEKELEESRQALIKVDWLSDLGDKLKFLHVPAIEIITPQTKVRAVSLAGASEIAQVNSIMSPDKKQAETPETQEDRVLEAKDVGFSLEKDVVGEGQEVFQSPLPRHQETVQPPKGRSFKIPGLGLLARIKNLGAVPRKVRLIPKAPLRKLEAMNTQKILVFSLTAFLFLSILGLVAWWFWPKATITLYVAPKKLERTEAVVINTQKDISDYQTKVLAGELVKVSASGEKTSQTTGTKLVGEMAKGKVEIRNGTSSAIKLSAGAVLIGPNDLKFNLDSSASISAAVSPSNPGTAIVEVTASDIGAEYNLAKGESFQVSNYPQSEVDGLSNEDFSGGSSRDISAVASEDRESLEKDLTEELELQAIEKINQGLSGDQEFIKQAILTSAVSQDFSHKVGDEASTLKLSMALETTGVVVTKKDLGGLAKKILENQVPSGFVLRENQIETEFSLDSEEDGIWEMEVEFIANLLPQIDTNEIAKAIAGKYPPLAQNYLANIPGFVRAEIRLSPRFPGRLGTLPRVLKNINIEVTAEK